MSVLKIKDENGNVIEIPALKGEDYILTNEDKQEIAEIVLSNFVDVAVIGQ